MRKGTITKCFVFLVLFWRVDIEYGRMCGNCFSQEKSNVVPFLVTARVVGGREREVSTHHIHYRGPPSTAAGLFWHVQLYEDERP